MSYKYIMSLTNWPPPAVGVEVQDPAVVDDHVQGKNVAQGGPDDFVREKLSPRFMESFMRSQVMVAEGKLITPVKMQYQSESK